MVLGDAPHVPNRPARVPAHLVEGHLQGSFHRGRLVGGHGDGPQKCDGLGAFGQLTVGFRQLGRALLDPPLERAAQRLDLGEALGVLQGGAGEGGDELGQSDLLLAEQGTDLGVGEVAAGHGPTPVEHRGAEGGADRIVAGVGLQDDRPPYRQRPTHQIRAQHLTGGSGHHRSHRRGAVAELDHRAVLGTQEGEGGLADGGVDRRRGERRGDLLAHAQQRVEAIEERQGHLAVVRWSYGHDVHPRAVVELWFRISPAGLSIGR